MRLNLGCGTDIKPGYVNVDARKIPGVDVVTDLAAKWPWDDGSVDEILMLDFLEHFPYRSTEGILQQAWKVLKPGGALVVQVPSFEECAAAMNYDVGMLCNACGFEWTEAHCLGNESLICGKCGQPRYAVAEAGMRRLYGGQDYEGNWHYTAFTKNSLQRKLKESGFKVGEFLEEEHQRLNWNMKIRAYKDGDLWGSEP